MKVAGIKLIPVTLLAVFLGACGGSSSTKDSSAGASVEDRGISSDEMNEIDRGAQSTGIGTRDGYATSALGDPNDPTGPLSVRVIYFDYDSANVRSEFRSTIEAHAAYLAAHPTVSISLEGHADERGSREYNLGLGEQRALTVRKQMVLLGASAGQIRAVSYGEERPVTEGHSEDSYALNRRVEIIY